MKYIQKKELEAILEAVKGIRWEDGREAFERNKREMIELLEQLIGGVAWHNK